MIRYAISTIVLLALLVLPGCATTGSAPVATDSFCISARKRIWSLDDTPESIHAARVWNKTVDARCGVQGKEA